MHEIKKHQPDVYKLYDYLKNNAIGYSNRKTSEELIEYLNIKSDCELRNLIRIIRDSDVLQKPICSTSGSKGNGYWVETSNERLLENLKKQKSRYLNGLKRVNKQIKKAKKNNQLRLRIFGNEKQIFESVVKR